MKTAFLGSSNPNGNTRRFAEACCRVCDAEIVDISNYNFTPWDYNGKNLKDDFYHLAELMLKSSDIIFCTPVYWYSMSCQMKTFFDRFSDLLTRRKEIGRALAGMRTWLIVVGNEKVMPKVLKSHLEEPANTWTCIIWEQFLEIPVMTYFHEKIWKKPCPSGTE